MDLDEIDDKGWEHPRHTDTLDVLIPKQIRNELTLCAILWCPSVAVITGDARQ